MRRDSSRSCPGPSSGFTLIELLLAFVITAVVVATVNFVFFETHKTIEAVVERREVYQTARIVLDRMVRDLNCAYVPSGGGAVSDDALSMWRFVGEHEEEGAVSRDSLTFTTAADIGFSRYPGCVREVAYYLEEDAENKGTYRLLRREDPTPHKGASTAGAVLEMAEGVGGLKIVYVDEYGQENDSWDLADRRKLPRSIRVTVRLGSDEQAVDFTATASPPLAGITVSSSGG
ncbi:MAG TPA: prepilin-type N-terminal cleavage/methylation domain-containing protein [Deltaproteobacteria bacterium]|nr:prepilin-type N-terminal cleavage/methylation domain-containing protein [Deltaproteobacteria bacterium]HOM29544.1 prepilin-type N-terminal cleavage/methylation domain-containing protein [Deltaproteobacteria bacterium]HPP79996.1 prepilin-type N-terminal cleavage/methylation domain-containing protein [Deltaproteobacteria bacterium]